MNLVVQDANYLDEVTILLSTIALKKLFLSSRKFSYIVLSLVFQKVWNLSA